MHKSSRQAACMHAKFMLPAATLLALSFSPVRPFASAPTGPRLRRSVPRAQLSDEAPDAELFGGLEAELARAADGRAPQRLSLFDRRANSEPPPRRDRDAVDPLGELTREDTRLFELPKTIGRLYDDFLNRPGQRLLLGALALLLGHYLAGSLSTIFGAAGFWEPISALLPALVCERISREYYMRGSRERSTTLELLNALKVGFLFGAVLDALKLAG